MAGKDKGATAACKQRLFPGPAGRGWLRWIVSGKGKTVFASSGRRPAKRLCQARRSNSVSEVARQPPFNFRLVIPTHLTRSEHRERRKAFITPIAARGSPSAAWYLPDHYRSHMIIITLDDGPHHVYHKQKPSAPKVTASSWEAALPAVPRYGLA